ncbi:hypothetical protein MMC25_000847 [Agyrium rufum]|nr:hypothetical protein [Agyrium rufum]
MQLDSAIIAALSLDPDLTTVQRHGSSGFTGTAKITTTRPESTEELHFFLKMGQGEAASVMFRGEHASLNTIHAVDHTLCPRAYAFGPLNESPNTFFPVTDFLNLSMVPSSSTKISRITLASKLAKLHTTSAPIPQGYQSPVFGFPYTTCCGDTVQENAYRSDWADFYAKNRLRAMVRKCEQKHGPDEELEGMVENMASVVVPRLLRYSHLNRGQGIVPVVVHGDLWSGNRGRGLIGGSDVVEEVVFDPSACYAHSEYELG